MPMCCQKNREKFSVYNGDFFRVPAVKYVPVTTQWLVVVVEVTTILYAGKNPIDLLTNRRRAIQNLSGFWSGEHGDC